MKTISVSDLKAHLSEQLRSVKGGSRLLITDRGKPVAELGPPISAADETLSALQGQGILRLGARTPSPDFWQRDRPRDAQGSVRQALLEERDGGR